jgi:hypothetical protein
MIHPRHGATHVYDNSEVERLKGWGWSVEVPKTFEPACLMPEEVLKASYEEPVPIATVPRRKPGRPRKVQ